ncbi:putative amidase [Cladobotryum mycophilum]|uniref:Amidase n=1 Tax=Cladobotryum mycophilum TaxID=491253 RepID=A0ABR0SJ01_9HYPO
MTSSRFCLRLLQVSTVSKAYLSQIKRHNDYLRAVINTAPESLLLERAHMLDEERKQGNIRGPLHGIPILIKNNIATNESTGLDTTAGSLALVNSKPRENAHIVDRLLEAGVILLGKAHLSELSWWKGKDLICGWNAVNGQSQSPYVRGGVLPDDSYGGHSNPGVSSCGSAIGVAAGFAPISIGTETFSSLMLPAGRAALYSLKPSRNHITTKGIVPISSFSDQPGPMTKTTKDLAVLLDIMTDPGHVPSAGYISRVTGSWNGLRIGTLDPEVWTYPPESRKVLDPRMEQQLNYQVREAYEVIRQHASAFQGNVPLSLPDTLMINDEFAALKVFEQDFQTEFESYLQLLETPQIKSLGELIEFNEKHADKELPSENGNQDTLKRSHQTSITVEERTAYAEHAERNSRQLSIDRILDEYNLNIIIGSAEPGLSMFSASSGYPVAAIPVGYLDFNRRPHGLCAIAREEGIFVQLLSAFEATFPQRSLRLSSRRLNKYPKEIYDNKIESVSPVCRSRLVRAMLGGWEVPSIWV